MPTVSLPQIDLFSLVIGTLFGAFASTWFYFFIRQPKLRHIGVASGSNFSCMTLQNEPGFLGLYVEDGGLFGRPFKRDIHFGLLVERMSARCTALIHDAVTNETTPLWWWTDQGEVVQAMTLESGQTANLILFSRQGTEEGRYYIWQRSLPNSLEGTVPPPERQLEGEREFTVVVHYGDWRKKRRFAGRVRRKASGNYQFVMPGGSSTF